MASETDFNSQWVIKIQQNVGNVLPLPPPINALELWTVCGKTEHCSNLITGSYAPIDTNLTKLTYKLIIVKTSGDM